MEKSRYHSFVRKGLPAAFLLATLLAVPAFGQVRGVPASVTSIGFGGGKSDNPPGIPASVTSLGPHGFDGSRFPTCCIQPLFPIHSRPPIDHRRHHPRFPFFGGGVVVYPYYYPTIIDQAPVDDAMEKEDYRGGPTIFDRRGPGNYDAIDSYVKRSEELRQMREERDREELEEAKAEIPSRAHETIADEPATILVFKDGHKTEVNNYAIVGDELYDFTPQHHRRIALADLDIPASVKANDALGIDFRVPSH
jgi:hypothetical protein